MRWSGAEKPSLEGERLCIGVQSENRCWVIYHECSLHLGEGSGICEAEGFGNSFFKAVNRIEPTY